MHLSINVNTFISVFYKIQKLLFILLVFFSATAYGEEEDEFESFSKAITKNNTAINDPFETYNRKIYKFNDVVDKYFLEKIATGYRFVTPKPVRNSITNFINNLSLPISAVNSVMQGKVDNSLATTSTFLINSTIGIFGLFDVAGQKKITYQPEDFGQTFAVYGLKSSPFLMLPLLGPSTVVDFSGSIANRIVSPTDFDMLNFSLLDSNQRALISATSIVNNREQLLDIIKDIRQNSFDSYAIIRSAYLQRRINQINN